VNIIEIIAIRCQILRLNCIKFNFDWGSASDSAGGEYSAPPEFKGPSLASKGSGGKRELRRGLRGRVPSTFICGSASMSD